MLIDRSLFDWIDSGTLIVKHGVQDRCHSIISVLLCVTLVTCTCQATRPNVLLCSNSNDDTLPWIVNRVATLEPLQSVEEAIFDLARMACPRT
jgi:hypothetical protein